MCRKRGGYGWSGFYFCPHYEPYKKRVEHFSALSFWDRLQGDNFAILDVKRRRMGVYKKGEESTCGAWIIRQLNEDEFKIVCEWKEHKVDYADLWRTFFESISINERENPSLQRNNMPLHYRKYATEFITE